VENIARNFQLKANRESNVLWLRLKQLISFHRHVYTIMAVDRSFDDTFAHMCAPLCGYRLSTTPTKGLSSLWIAKPITTQYLSQHIWLRTSARNTRSSSVPLLRVPFRRTSLSKRSFSTAAILTWNSLPPAMLNCDSLLQCIFKSRNTTHMLSAVLLVDLRVPPAPL